MNFAAKRRLLRRRQGLWRALVSICLVLAALGVILPLLPTTPFVLLAAWAAPKASPALARKLLAHPRYGPLLLNWREHRALPLQAKVLAPLMLAASWSLLYYKSASEMLLWPLGVFFLGLAAYLISRPLSGARANPTSAHSVSVQPPS